MENINKAALYSLLNGKKLGILSEGPQIFCVHPL